MKHIFMNFFPRLYIINENLSQSRNQIVRYVKRLRNQIFFYTKYDTYDKASEKIIPNPAKNISKELFKFLCSDASLLMEFAV